MSRNVDGRIPVTKDMLDELREWQDKTGYGITAIFRHAEINKLFKRTRSLTPAAFNSILQGKTRTVFEADFAKVINAYESLRPDMWGRAHALTRRKGRVPVPDTFKTDLLAMLEQTSMSRSRLLSLYGAPADLTNTKLGLILKRENTTILKAHLEFLERLIETRSKPD